MKKIIASTLTFIYIMCHLSLCRAADNNDILPEFPDIKSQYIVLMDADSGEVLYQRNMDKKCYPASTTKMMTALLTIENTSMSDVVTYSKAAVDSVSPGDANVGIAVGEQLTVEQSLYCLMLRSANDVAYGLAEYVGGTASGFASMMNDKAAALGAVSTHFSNPSGLTNEFHYSTPYDMALIGRACFNNKTLVNIMSYTGVYKIGKTNTNNNIRYYTHRFQMLKGGEYEYRYSKGGKTGYTDAAGNCLVSFAEKDGIRLVCSVMNSTASGRYTDSIALFDYYLNNYRKCYLDDNNMSSSSFGLDALDITYKMTSTNGYSIEFDDGAYILVPSNANISDLTKIVTYADNAAYSGKSGGFACISFYYKNLPLGNSTIYIKDNKNSSVTPGTNGVMTEETHITINKDKTIYINIFVLIGAVAGLSLIIVPVAIRVKNRRRHRRGFHF